MVVRTARIFGAVGDDVHDDTLALQTAFNKLPYGATLVLKPDGVYKLTDPLTVPLGVTIEGNGATLKQYGGGVVPFGITHLSIGSTRGAEESSPQVLLSGQRPNFAALPTEGMYAYGQDQYNMADPAVYHYVGFADAGALPPIAPFDIYGTVCKRWPVAKINANLIIRDLILATGGGVTLDFSIGLDGVRGVLLSNITANLTTLFQIKNCEAVTIRGINATVNLGHSSAGRIMTVDQSRGISVSGVTGSITSGAPPIFCESWAGGIALDNWNLTQRDEGHQDFGGGYFSPQFPIIQAVGGTNGLVYKNFRVTSPLNSPYWTEMNGQADEPLAVNRIWTVAA